MSYEIHRHTHSHVSNRDEFELLHKKKSIRIIDRFALIIGALAPLTSLPQVFQILKTQNAEGVSVLTWLLWVCLGFFWLIYGIAHKEKAIIVNNLLWVILEFIIVFLAIVY